MSKEMFGLFFEIFFCFLWAELWIEAEKWDVMHLGDVGHCSRSICISMQAMCLT